MNSYETRTLTERDRAEVLERDENKCQYCGSEAEAVDHIIPWSHCHNNSIFNLVASCNICNSVASNKVFETFIEKKNHVITRRLQMLARRAVPIWTKDEVSTLRGRIKDMVLASCVVVENREEGMIIATRLAQDGFSVTFGDNEELNVEQLMEKIKRDKERLILKTQSNAETEETRALRASGDCIYCGKKYFVRESLEWTLKKRQYCSSICRSRASAQRRLEKTVTASTSVNDVEQ